MLDFEKLSHLIEALGFMGKLVIVGSKNVFEPPPPKKKVTSLAGSAKLRNSNLPTLNLEFQKNPGAGWLGQN